MVSSSAAFVLLALVAATPVAATPDAFAISTQYCQSQCEAKCSKNDNTQAPSNLNDGNQFTFPPGTKPNFIINFPPNSSSSSSSTTTYAPASTDATINSSSSSSSSSTTTDAPTSTDAPTPLVENYCDDCDVCDLDSSNNNESCSQDCDGVWAGLKIVDDCDECVLKENACVVTEDSVEEELEAIVRTIPTVEEDDDFQWWWIPIGFTGAATIGVVVAYTQSLFCFAATAANAGGVQKAGEVSAASLTGANV